MENEEAKNDSFLNQNIIITACITISLGGITFLLKYLFDKCLSYSLIPIGLALISWILSIISGFIFLVKRGNNSARASTGKEGSLHPDFHRAPKYIEGQLYLMMSGIGFMVIWLVWNLLINTYSWFPR